MPEPGKNRDDVRAAIAADLRPVAPLASPWKRALAVLVPWVAVVLALVCGASGLRPDIDAVGRLASWGASGLFVVGAGVLAVCLLREGVPGARLARAHVVGALLVILAAQLGMAAWLHDRHPYPVAAGDGWRLVLACGGAIGAFAAPLLLALMFLVRRGTLTGPAAGLLAGAGAVIAAEAMWRLHCPFTSPGHLLAAHFPPYLPLVAVGFLLARTRGAGGSRRAARSEPT